MSAKETGCWIGVLSTDVDVFRISPQMIPTQVVLVFCGSLKCTDRSEERAEILELGPSTP